MLIARRLLPLFVLAVVVAMYVPSLHTAYVWDDHVLLEHVDKCRGDLVRCLTTPFFPTTPFLDVPPAYYRPVVTLSYALPGDLVVQHLTNVLFHALNAVLLALLARRFGASSEKASLAALAWALHPRLVEDVTWISGRTDVLATTFVLSALLAWPDREEDRRRTVAALVLALLGLLAKEVAIAGFFAIAAVWGAKRARVLAVPAIVYAVLRLGIAGVSGFSSSLGAGTRIATTGEAAARYVEMTLRFMTPWSSQGAIGVVEPAHAALGFVLLAALAYGMVRVVRGGPPGVAAGATLATFALLPVLHLLPISLHGGVTADRVLYLPLAGLALVVASLPLPRLVAVPALALVAAEAFFLVPAQHAFDDEVVFGLTTTERADPNNVGPVSVLATVVRDGGVPELACPLFEQARRALERTGRTQGSAYGRAVENLGACLAQTGRYDESVALYRELAAARPRSGRIALGLGYALLHRLDFDEAKAAFARAAELDAKLAPLARDMQARTERAAADRAALSSPDPVTRARYAASVGRSPDAEKAWTEAVRDDHVLRGFRLEGIRYLALDGNPDDARLWFRFEPDAQVRDQLQRRAAAYDVVMRHAERIKRLSRAP